MEKAFVPQQNKYKTCNMLEWDRRIIIGALIFTETNSLKLISPKKTHLCWELNPG